MKKRPKKEYTLKEAVDRIPHDIDYCLDSGKCPFFQIRTMTKTKYIRLVKEGKLSPFAPCWYTKGRKWQAEYCTWLKEYLAIQDGIKDCSINRYHDSFYDPETDTEKPNEDITFNDIICGKDAQQYYQKEYPEDFKELKNKNNKR